MRLNIVNHSSRADAPLHDLWNATGVFLYHVCAHWPGANHVVDDLIKQKFYFELVDSLPEAPGALGYHSIDDNGNPFSKIAVNPSFENGSGWVDGPYAVSSVLTHEAGETAGNPILNIERDFPDWKKTVAQELCDPVEDSFYEHLGINISNFVLPSWFNPFGKYPFDYMGILKAPFTMTPGGYMIVTEDGQTGQVTGDTLPDWRKTHYGRAAVLLGSES